MENYSSPSVSTTKLASSFTQLEVTDLSGSVSSEHFKKRDEQEQLNLFFVVCGFLFKLGNEYTSNLMSLIEFETSFRYHFLKRFKGALGNRLYQMC